MPTNPIEQLAPGRPLKAVSFDLWLTLIRPSEAGRRGRANAIAAALRVEVTDEFMALTQEVNEELDAFSARTGEDRSCEDRVALIAAKLGLPAPDAGTLRSAADACQTSILENLPELIEADLPQTLAKLRARGLKIATVSNTGYPKGATMRQVLARLGVAQHVSEMLFSNETGRAKPDQKIFEMAQAALGCERDEILHVGDSRAADLEGARAAGFRAVLFSEAATGSEGAISTVASLVN
jgi:putative hydrolase of the HAD superfamily